MARLRGRGRRLDGAAPGPHLGSSRMHAGPCGSVAPPAAGSLWRQRPATSPVGASNLVRAGHAACECCRESLPVGSDGRGLLADCQLVPAAARMVRCCCEAVHGLTSMFALIRLLPMGDRDKDAEILARRHRLAVLQRQIDKPKLTWPDRGLGDPTRPKRGHGPSGCGRQGQVLDPGPGRSLPDRLRRRPAGGRYRGHSDRRPDAAHERDHGAMGAFPDRAPRPHPRLEPGPSTPCPARVRAVLQPASPHRTLASAAPLRPLPEPISEPDGLTHLEVHRRDRVGGTLHEYQHAA